MRKSHNRRVFAPFDDAPAKVKARLNDAPGGREETGGGLDRRAHRR